MPRGRDAENVCVPRRAQNLTTVAVVSAHAGCVLLAKGEGLAWMANMPLVDAPPHMRMHSPGLVGAAGDGKESGSGTPSSVAREWYAVTKLSGMVAAS